MHCQLVVAFIALALHPCIQRPFVRLSIVYRSLMSCNAPRPPIHSPLCDYDIMNDYYIFEPLREEEKKKNVDMYLYGSGLFGYSIILLFFCLDL